jgi:chemotaxis protein methyltransferase CheR
MPNFMRDSEFEFIRNLVYKRSRISLGPDKRELVAARVGKRLRAVELASFGAYCRLLQTPAGKEESDQLIDAISTHHTAFFREKDHFEFIRSRIVPEMLARSRADRWQRLHAWSAACSSGEEPYSLAITLAEALQGSAWTWHVEATDISSRVLRQAESAVYPSQMLDPLPAERVRAHFQQGIGPQTGNYRVKRDIQSGVTFRQLNLLGDPPPFTEPFQLILCRNVMIYFDQPTQEELVNRLASRLVPGGYLLVGHAESLTGIRHSLQMVKTAVYRRPAAP